MTAPAARPAAASQRSVAPGLLLLLPVAVAVGLAARFRGLGARPLAVDEFYFVTSVRAILDTGLPALPGGGYYTRGLLPQYATAAAALVFGEGGLAWRLPAVLASLGTVAATYAYVLPSLGRAGAVALAAVLLVSSWEVEFARFARMYAPFQLATLLFLATADRAFFEPRTRLRYAPHALAVVATLCHSLGILLAPIVFAPLVLTPRRFARPGPWLRYAAASGATLLVCLALARFDFRNLGVVDRFPVDWAPEGGESLRLLALPFFSETAAPLAGVAALAAALVFLGGLAVAARRRPIGSELVAAALFGAAALHQLVIAGACAGLLLLRFRIQRAPRAHRGAWIGMAAGGLATAAWGAAAFATRGWVDRALPGEGTLLGAVRRTFFGWPDLYGPLVVPFARELPGIGLAVAAASAYQLVTRLRDPWPGLARNPVWILVYVALAFGVLGAPYASTRYAFFVYPVALCVVALSLRDVLRALAPRGAHAEAFAAAAFVALFALAGDFQPAHLAAVSSPEVTFRTGPFERHADTWYPRWDGASAAAFVNERARPEDAVVVVGLPTVPDTLETDYAVYYDRETDGRFGNVSRERGTREVWTGHRLLGTPAQVRDYASGAPRAWLVRDAAHPWLEPARVWGDRLLRAEAVFRSRDGRVEVVAVSLAPAARPSP